MSTYFDLDNISQPKSKRPRLDEAPICSSGFTFTANNTLPAIEASEWSNLGGHLDTEPTDVCHNVSTGTLDLLPNFDNPLSQPFGSWSQQPGTFLGAGNEAFASAHIDFTINQPPCFTLPNILSSYTPDEDEMVCFGMVDNITATYEQRSQEALSPYFTVQLKPSAHFTSDIYKSFLGRIQTEHCHMIEGLLEEKSLKLHVRCTPAQGQSTKKRGRSNNVLYCSLSIIIYGPLGLFGDIGDWFQDYGVYLQDPESCNLDVPDTKYYNPHRMSSSDFHLCPMVSEVISESSTIVLQELPELPDYLEILGSYADLEEAPQPSSINTALKRHQKQALTFMLNREKGWGFGHDYPDIWETIYKDHTRIFFNTVSRACQFHEPARFSGGIIADPMGLGKTLTMISLVATDIDSKEDIGIYQEDTETGKQGVAATLVVIPPPILNTWEQQIQNHTIGGTMMYRRHHGKTRLVGIEELNGVSFVLTTYHTVAAEWKANTGTQKSVLFSVRWKRIILDEAHFIRNGNSNMAGAVCALESVSRWAVTGTPIQNRLSDLASLLKFVRVYPYTDPKQFEADISRPWKSGEDEEAVRRLKRLAECLLLRRPKAIINLPPRRDQVYPVEFTPEERLSYERLRQQTIAHIEEALRCGTGMSMSHGYINALQHIESLRLFSNLGLFYESRHKRRSHQPNGASEWSNTAQRVFDSQRDMSSITCSQCSSALGLADTLLDDTTSNAEAAQYTSCLKFICSECVDRLRRRSQTAYCDHNPPCDSAAVSTSGAALEEIDSSASLQLRMAAFNPPSKIKALLEDIRGVDSNVKCIVFSTWRLTLDLIKAGLDREGIQSIRFDGKVSQKDRPAVVERFESDPNVRVMLLTLSCGAVGLTLTAASRAYLMEPHWNPTLEEQALARIHRLGQTREVTTVRFCVRDSFEEEVVKIQESKKQLAGVLLPHQDNGDTDSSRGALERLRSLL
ncbi:SNF2 family N-terminal domain-containing protein [Hypoxylon trugodes]|uniref:SNF2 family N-terminal domain-containing protein n=1 Tax=Hypoxylon trugodes TaxID=326681 RepID=UPI00218CA657|nr:SNF2 family N-terminal domain-containing protein [Hypoxylon trugodes]KAI1388866.1 SNF2 family N-terminal domain-containing protein [Hypoxylon trugodes]